MVLQMTTNYIYIPFDRQLYNDIVQFSDGRLDPVSLAEEQVLDLIERNLDNNANDWFCDRLIDFVKAHFPYRTKEFEERLKEIDADDNFCATLIWKEVSVPSGTHVRMHYNGVHHFARVKNGHIEDADGRFSPSEWARKVANNTSRNAWRDLSFKAPLESVWVPAELLRSQAKARLQKSEV